MWWLEHFYTSYYTNVLPDSGFWFLHIGVRWCCGLRLGFKGWSCVLACWVEGVGLCLVLLAACCDGRELGLIGVENGWFLLLVDVGVGVVVL